MTRVQVFFRKSFSKATFERKLSSVSQPECLGSSRVWTTCLDECLDFNNDYNIDLSYENCIKRTFNYADMPHEEHCMNAAYDMLHCSMDWWRWMYKSRNSFCHSKDLNEIPILWPSVLTRGTKYMHGKKIWNLQLTVISKMSKDKHVVTTDKQNTNAKSYTIYTVGHKKGANLFFFVTLSKINGF